MSKKWYNYIVSVDDATGTEANSPSAPANPRNAPGGTKNAAQSVAEIASSIATEPKFTTPISDPTSFDEIYKAAEIPPAPQGYSILKVSQMLESEHIRNLPSDVKNLQVWLLSTPRAWTLRKSSRMQFDATARWIATSGFQRARDRRTGSSQK